MILVLGGTADAVEFIAGLTQEYIVTVATEYGYRRFRELYGDHAVCVRFTEETLAAFIREKKITAVADCTHPFAQEISAVAQAACTASGVPYLCRKRRTGGYRAYRGLHYAQGWEAAVEYVKRYAADPLFFTIGSKNLHRFECCLDHAVVRVLDDADSINICCGLGLPEERILARRGPFSVEDNLEVIRKFRIRCTVSKDSGKRGGVPDKIEAAAASGTDIVIVQR